MPSLSQGMIVLIVIATLVAGVSHWRIRNLWIASVVSGVATCAVFYVASFIQEGGAPQPATVKAFALFAGFGFVVAVLTGLVSKVFRPAISRGA